jgi:CRP/FNR family cyclic AMP-dependent transcriptional regulator
VTLNILGPGDVFGEIALLDGHPRTAEAVALEATDLFVVNRHDFLGLLAHDAALAARIIGFLCLRLRWMSERMEEATLLSLDARLARRLIMLFQDYGAEIHVTQQELAAFVGAARESVNRTLQGWQRSGIIELGRSRVTVKMAQRLVALGERHQL